MNLDAFICFLSAVIYHNTLDAGFVYDDSRAILSNPDVYGSTPWRGVFTNDFWGTPLASSGSHGSYRPLCVLSFRATHWACGFKPWGYHALNVLLHSLATGLVLKVGRRILPCRGANAAGMLFAVHPIHSEAVAGIVGRADLLACVFFLLSFLAYLKHVEFRDVRHPASTRKPPSSKNRLPHRPYIDALCRDLFAARRKCASVRSQSHWDVLKCDSWLAWGFLLASVLLAALAMLSKETGITVLALCAVFEMSRMRALPSLLSRRSVSLMSLGAAVLVLVSLRLHVMGMRPPSFASCDNPTARTSSWLARSLTFLYLPAFNFKLLLWPRWLSYDWSMEAIPRVTSLFDPRNLLTAIVYTSFYTCLRIGLKPKSKINETYKTAKLKPQICSDCEHIIQPFHSSLCRLSNNNNSPPQSPSCECDYYNKHPQSPPPLHLTYNQSLLMCLAFLIIPFLPATNLFFYVGFVVAERVLYIPSVGFCFLVGLGYHLLLKRADFKLIRLCFVMTLVVLGARTHHRNRDWTDEESLYRSGIPINPPKSWGNLGSVLSSQGRMEEAEYAFRKALEFRPNMADVHYNLGILQQGKGQYNEAIVSYQMAIKFRPSLALAHLNLGQLLASRGRCPEAEAVLRRCWHLDGVGLKDQRTHHHTRVSAMLALGRMLSDHGQHSRAVGVYREAVHNLPEHYQPQTLYNLLGEELGKIGNHEEAERWFKAALDASPDHVPAHLTYGKLLAKNRTRAMEAELWFKRAQELAPSDPAVYTHFGDFLGGLERHMEAAKVENGGSSELISAQYLNDFLDMEENLFQMINDEQHTVTAPDNLSLSQWSKGGLISASGDKIMGSCVLKQTSTEPSKQLPEKFLVANTDSHLENTENSVPAVNCVLENDSKLLQEPVLTKCNALPFENEHKTPVRARKVERLIVDEAANSPASASDDNKSVALERSVSSQMGNKKMSGFTAFARQMRSEILKETPGISFTAVAGILASKWRSLQDNEKEKYYCIASNNKKKKLETVVKKESVKSFCETHELERNFIVSDASMELLARSSLDMISENSYCRVVGRIESSDVWICSRISQQGSPELGAINSKLLDEAHRFKQNMDMMEICVEPLERSIVISPRFLTEKLWDVLLSLESVPDASGEGISITDKRIVMNGFRIKISKQENVCAHLTGLARHLIDAYGADDVKMTLELIEKHGVDDCSLAQSRCPIARKYIRSETSRQCAQMMNRDKLNDAHELENRLRMLENDKSTCWQSFYKPLHVPQ